MCSGMRIGIYQFYRQSSPSFLLFRPLSAFHDGQTALTTQTSEAADKCFQEKRKTIGGEDILTSMQALGFDNYAGVMKVYLSKYRVVRSSSFLTSSFVASSCLPLIRLLL